jgi:hypothetical protein
MPENVMICRRRTENIRVTAESMQDTKSREAMFKIAEDYERMADSIQAKAIPPQHMA